MLRPPRRHVPDLLFRRVGEVDIPMVADANVVAIDVLSDDALVAFLVVGSDAAFAILARVQFSLRAKCQSVCAPGFFFEDSDCTVEADFVNSVPWNVSEE